jgi:hypothetical protein
MSKTSFAADIRPLFRDKDIKAMKGRFDLSDYGDVSEHADKIHQRLSAGTMPCDGAWPAAQLDLFQKWIDDGKPV